MIDPRSIDLPPNIERKEYQIDGLCGVVARWEAGDHSTLLLMPTGTGKTITSGLISKYAMEAYGHGVLFLAHRIELIEQATNTFMRAFGFTTAVEMGGDSEQAFIKLHGQEPEVVVATVQSLHADRLASRFRKNRFGLIIIDEAHRSAADSYGAVLDYFEDYLLLGVTATPDGASKNLGIRYQSIAYQLRLRKAIEQGHLVRPKIRRIKVPVNLREIATTGGDFNVGELAERIGPAIEILCEQLHANLGNRKTVVFTPDVGSAQAVAMMLALMGRKAEYVAGPGGKFGMSKKERKDKLKRFGNNEFQIIVCCDLLVEGWDMPDVSCVVIARPTLKRYKYVQMVGRGLRLFPGKTNCLVLDLDWQQDDSSRALCMPHCLFAEGNESKEALEVLAERMTPSENRDFCGSDGLDWKEGVQRKDVDILEELGAIEADLHHARVIQVKYTGKHKQLYEAVDNSPFGIGKVLDISVRKSKDFDPYKCGPATPFQVEKLKKYHIEGAEKMNLWGASRLLQKLDSREKKGLASHQQVKELLRSGVNEDQARNATKKQAAAIIGDQLIKQGEMF